MDIQGYTYIAHKIIHRPWGFECRFVVARPDGTHINDITIIPSDTVTDEEITTAITSRLKMVDIPVLAPEPEPVVYTEAQVKEMLVEKGYITEGESITDLRPKTEIVELATVVEKAL